MRTFLKHVKDRLQGKAEKGQKRSSQWGRIRREFLQRNQECAVCGSKKNVEAHHIMPFSLFPDLELDKDNLIALCDGNGKYGIKSCHLLYGHLGNFRLYNPAVSEDAYLWNKKIKG